MELNRNRKPNIKAKTTEIEDPPTMDSDSGQTSSCVSISTGEQSWEIFGHIVSASVMLNYLGPS
jgi:hypothetical protein